MVGERRILKARILWSIITTGEPSDEKKAFQTTAAAVARRLKYRQNQAKALTMILVPIPSLACTVIQGMAFPAFP